MKMYKTIKKCLLLMLVVMMVTCEGAAVASAAVSTGAAGQQTASAPKNGWVKSGSNYYYYVNNKKVVNSWKTIGGKKYYFGADGARKTGWYTVVSEGKCYSFSSKGVWSGKSKKINKTLVKKLDSVLKSSKASSSAGTAALKKAASYLANKNRYKYGRAPMGFNPVTAAAGWQEKLAYELLNTKTGSCYHHAAAFAYLAKRTTGLPVRICVGTACVFNKSRWQKHGWVEVKVNGQWYIYDTNAMAFSTLKSGKWYNLKHTDYENKYYKTEKTFEVII